MALANQVATIGTGTIRFELAPLGLCKGRTAPGMFALLATCSFKEYGVDESALGAVAVKNHWHGSLHPNAHFQRTITPEQHARPEGRRAARPLRLLPDDRRGGGVRPDARGPGRAARPAARPDPWNRAQRGRAVLEHPVRPVVEFHVVPGDARGAAGGNTSGGLKSCGHPVGASGIGMINNVADQLLDRAGRMQVRRARTGLAHPPGGSGAVSCVAVLGQP